MPYPSLPCPALPCPALPCPAFCFALPCPVLPFLLPYPAMHCHNVLRCLVICLALCFACITTYSLRSHVTTRSLLFASMLAKRSERFVLCERSERFVLCPTLPCTAMTSYAALPSVLHYVSHALQHARFARMRQHTCFCFANMLAKQKQAFRIT